MRQRRPQLQRTHKPSVSLQLFVSPENTVRPYGPLPLKKDRALAFTETRHLLAGLLFVRRTGAFGLFVGVPGMRKLLLSLLIVLAAGFMGLTGCGGSGIGAGFAVVVAPSPIMLTGGTTQSISVGSASTGGFNAPVTFTFSGLPAGVTVSPATLIVTGGMGQNLALMADTTVTASHGTLTVTGVSGNVTHTATATLIVAVAPPPDFTMSVNPTALTVAQGAQANALVITATPVSGFSAPVAVTITGLPAGVTANPASLTLVPGTGQSVSLTANASTAVGSSTVTFTGTSGALSHAATLSLTVQAPAPPPVGSSPDVTTYHFDNARDGLNAQETLLTPATVTSANFGKIAMFQGDGKVDAQPLYLAGLNVAGTATNVLYMATEHGSLYAFDADKETQIWTTSLLGTGEVPSDDHSCGQISPEIGITSTPVIDRAKGVIYAVGMSKDAKGVYHQRLHALNLTSGAELAGSPAEITGSYPGTGAGSAGGMVPFTPGQYAERAGLLLLNGTIYLSWTSHCDDGLYTGWVMAYSESTLQQTAILNLTPNGSEGSIWMAGNGLASDASGNIYFLDANGTMDPSFDGNGFPAQQDYGNAMMKLSTAGGKLAVADFFEPYNTIAESNGDIDMGSGGALLLPDMTDASGTTRHLIVGAGKDRNIFVGDRDNLGKFNQKTANNSNLYQDLPNALANGAWSSPAYFNNTVYYAGQNDTLKAFPITQGKLATSPSSQSVVVFPYPGSTPSVSANGTQDGIVWAVESNTGQLNVLHAYDATNLSRELYNSNQAAGSRDSFGNGNKFITPVIVNGKVFVGTQTGVAEFGLLP